MSKQLSQHLRTGTPRKTSRSHKTKKRLAAKKVRLALKAKKFAWKKN